MELRIAFPIVDVKRKIWLFSVSLLNLCQQLSTFILARAVDSVADDALLIDHDGEGEALGANPNVSKCFISFFISIHFISFHDNHRTARNLPHLAFHFVTGITALEVGGEREPAFALDVDDADSDAVFLLAF